MWAHGNDSAQSYDKGLELLVEEKYDIAIDLFSKAIVINNLMYTAYYHRGLAYMYLGQYNKAICDFNTVIARNTWHFRAFYFRAKSYYAIGLHEKAISDLSVCLQENVEDESVLCLLGEVYYTQKNYIDAACSFISALELNQNNTDARGYIMRLSKATIFEAIKTFPEKRKYDLLRNCLSDSGFLGQRFWKAEFPWTGCSIEKGYLSKIKQELDKMNSEKFADRVPLQFRYF